MDRADEEGVINNMHLMSMFTDLPPKQQVVLALRTAGYTQKECGIILGVTRAAVGFNYHRAVQLLREAANDGTDE